MIYEVRFQNVDPARRDEYVAIYTKAIQEIKTVGVRAASRSSVARMARARSSSWWSGKARFRGAVEGSGLQTSPSERGYFSGGPV
jgi:hypothetical protein